MKQYAFLPFAFLKFWYIESPRELFLFFLSLNKAFLQLFSLSLFLRTFLKPLKNEYREGLVRFSVGMGIFVKAIFIFVDLLLFSALVLVEIGILVFFIVFPIATIWMLFL